MNGWRVLGRAILVGVDALGAGLLVGLLAFFLTPWYGVSTRLELAVVLGGAVTGVAIAVALALAGAGRRPFPATRLGRAALDRLPLWWP